MHALGAILFLLTIGPRHASCHRVPAEAVPAAARRELSLQASDEALEHVCRVQTGVRTVYRAHDQQTGITVDVTPSGELLGRGWSEIY